MAEEKVSSWVLERVGHEGTIRLPEGDSEVGRLPRCGIRICSRFCSRKHCKFSVCCDKITVSDFSSNGVFVNGKQFVGKEVELYNNDRVGIGVEATDEECARDMEYFVFILRKTPLTKEVTNSPRPREKNRDPNVSKSDICDCSKLEREGITDEIQKDSKVAVATDNKYEDEVSSNEVTLSGRKRIKLREFVDKENMDLIDILEDGLPLKTRPPSRASIENTKQPDETSPNHVFLISDDEEQADNETFHHNKSKTSNFLQKVSTNLTKSDADETEFDKTNDSNSAASSKNSKHFSKTEGVDQKNFSDDARSMAVNKQANLVISTKLDSTKRECSPKNADKKDISCNGTILASEKHANIENLKNNEKNVQATSEFGNSIFLARNTDAKEMLMSQSLIKPIKRETLDLEVFINAHRHVEAFKVENTLERSPIQSKTDRQTEEEEEKIWIPLDLDMREECELPQFLISDIKQEIADLETLISEDMNIESNVDNAVAEQGKEDMSTLIDLRDVKENILQILETNRVISEDEEGRKPNLAEKRKMLDITDPSALPEKRGK